MMSKDEAINQSLKRYEPKTPVSETELEILRRRCAAYETALEIIAGNEADVNREKADGIAIAALAGRDGAY